ncbi:MAG: sulfatase-like hydrolase/transferase, partial [Verrucomicrobiota bacterium JB024]|nr:sulfatase-like hydrolase/transferase [Verrucomicrobiota bacterium JB024]
MSASEPPLNILFLMTDQQRYDCIGYAPASKIATPNIDRIAEGTAFSCCQTVNPICQPARTALLTGRYSHQIGTLQMSGDLDFSIPTYPQALQRAGYWTAGVGKFHYLQTWPWDTPRGQGVPLARLHEQFRSLGYDHLWESAGKQQAAKNTCDYCNYLKEHGLLEDFRDWVATRGGNNELITAQLDKDGDPWPFGEEHHIDIVTGREILRAIDARPAERPFFIFGSFCSPHKPFDPPQRFLDQVPYEEIDDFLPGEDGELTLAQKKTLWKLRRSYKATLLLVDEQIGKILDRLESEGLLENTLILFTSDHGEMMGDHFRVQKSTYYRESLNVPLAIRHPRHLQGTRNDSPVELTDITATILDAAGLDPCASLARDWPAFGNILPGRSLLPIAEGQAEIVR